MKSFRCFSVILLATRALSESLSFCPSTQIKYCVVDDYFRALSDQTTSASQFCNKYLEDDSINLPNYLSTQASASSVSSACSCLIQAQPTPNPTAVTPSSYVSGYFNSSTSSVATTVVPKVSGEYTASTIYATYTTLVNGKDVTQTLTVVGSTAVLPVTQNVAPTPTSQVQAVSVSAYSQYETSTIYKVSTYTNLGQTITQTMVDYVTVYPGTTKPISQDLNPTSAVEYTTSTVYSLATSTYTTNGQTITSTGTVIDYTTVSPVTKLPSLSTIGAPALSSPSVVSSIETEPVQSSTTSTRSFFFGNTTSSIQLAISTGASSYVSRIADPSSIRYPFSNSTLSQTPSGTENPLPISTVSVILQQTASSTSYPMSNSTSLYLPTGTGIVSSIAPVMSNSTSSALPLETASSAALRIINSTASLVPSGTGIPIPVNSTMAHIPSGTGFSVPANSTTSIVPSGTGSPLLINSTTSFVPSGTGIPIPMNSTTSAILPNSTSSDGIISSTSTLPVTTDTPIKIATSPSFTSTLPSATAFCSTDGAALLFAAGGIPATSYCSSLLSIQPTKVDGGYAFVTQTVYTATTTAVFAPSNSVVKRQTITTSVPYRLTSTYDLVQQSSACSCLSIQPSQISVTTTIIVPAKSTIVVSTTSIPAILWR